MRTDYEKWGIKQKRKMNQKGITRSGMYGI